MAVSAAGSYPEGPGQATPEVRRAPIQLPAPQIHGGKPLMEALRDRRSTRSFLPDDLPLQTLSNLLWAGFGVNRPGTGYRTAPSAVNWQEVDIYLATREGAYRYDAQANRLEPSPSGKQRIVRDGRVPANGTRGSRVAAP